MVTTRTLCFWVLVGGIVTAPWLLPMDRPFVAALLMAAGFGLIAADYLVYLEIRNEEERNDE